MLYKHLKHLFLILILASGAGRTFAAVDVSVRAFIDGSGPAFATTEDDPAFDNARAASGRAYRDAVLRSASVIPFGSVCTPVGESLCGMQGFAGGSAFTQAEANGVAGSLRAFARSSADPDTPLKHASASATLTDMITFLAPPVVNFDVDLASTLLGVGRTSLTFTFGLKNYDLRECEDEGQCGFADTVLARLFVAEIRDTTADIEFELYRLSIEGINVESDDVVLNSDQFSYDIADYVEPGPDTLEIFAELSVNAGTGSAGEGLPPIDFTSLARMAADQSAFLQIDNVISANGSSYLGRPSPVPLPAPLALFAFGLAGLGGVARGRQRPTQLT